MPEYTSKLNLYKPNRVDSEITVDTSLSENFQKIDDGFDEVAQQLAQTNRLVKHPIVQDLLKTPTIMAHRGLMSTYPENTIAAFYECYKRGVRYFEIDFRKTADGVWVCIHDDNTLRTTGVDKVVDSTNSNELINLSQPLITNASLYDNPTIPTMDEVFTFIRDTNTIFNINFDYGLLQADVPTVVNKIHEYNIANNVIVQRGVFDFYTNDFCMTEYVPLNENAFIDISQKGNIIPAYPFNADVGSAKQALLLANKYNVPILIYTVSKLDEFNSLDSLGVHCLMVDKFWVRSGLV